MEGLVFGILRYVRPRGSKDKASDYYQGISGSNPGVVGFLESYFAVVLQTCITNLIFFQFKSTYFVVNHFLLKNLPHCLLYVNNI